MALARGACFRSGGRENRERRPLRYFLVTIRVAHRQRPIEIPVQRVAGVEDKHELATAPPNLERRGRGELGNNDLIRAWRLVRPAVGDE